MSCQPRLACIAGFAVNDLLTSEGPAPKHGHKLSSGGREDC